MLAFPSCKINIGLQLIERRADGFHNLLSAFYPVGWTDVLEIIPAISDKTAANQPVANELVTFTTSGLPIPGDPDPARNLCVRAYHLLQADYDLPPVQMHLHKIVPIGAGLGGGSADAAATINLLNEQFALGLTVAQRENYARELGSDCAFFIQNKPQYCIEKGDVFESINLDLNGYHILLVYPNLAISTAEAYAGVTPRQPDTPLRALLEAPIEQWRDTVHNDFEDSLFPKYPLLGEIKAQLYEAGALYASLSGSGSTLYGIFNAPPNSPPPFSRYTVWKSQL
ncbi:4-(cytidine 5'-diphospho)-2-C-methyl-D-erythritol kinase [Fibrella sp. HMF5335]|uniref:4-diphosphocytidyl-2-C-methyl-D-erythritol kinase n=1 Tax=Fibrella rubiginis TaxID=2817060 RepID=A0A939GMC6_9BACT|nr:4-(cytidine 5'-diphospho)-2-C-methyl-D-erythritol kinase [Fibrella rubiginis]MBO0940019.1 4-(cytidine 5'-diphospho)-2-C-methyl-D-erythritol kinase [Fibrella rubiginis]